MPLSPLNALGLAILIVSFVVGIMCHMVAAANDQISGWTLLIYPLIGLILYSL